MKSYAQVKAIEAKNKRRILEICPQANESSGIYIFYREENGFKFGYVGQAKHILTRLAQHFTGYQHIDLSLKKHGLWSEENPTGYRIWVTYCAESELDDKEQYWVLEMANKGVQLRNKTSGSQSDTKRGLDTEHKQPKGYHDGVKYGYDKARKEIKHLFDLHLNAVIKSDKPNKTQEKALQKFKDFLDGSEK